MSIFMKLSGILLNDINERKEGNLNARFNFVWYIILTSMSSMNSAILRLEINYSQFSSDFHITPKLWALECQTHSTSTKKTRSLIWNKELNCLFCAVGSVDK